MRARDTFGWWKNLLPVMAIMLLSAATALNSQTADAGGKTIYHADTFPEGAAPVGWSHRCYPNAGQAEFSVVETPSLGGEGSLSIYGNSLTAVNGCWYTDVPGIEPGGYYRFSASFRTKGVSWPRRQTMARLDWRDSQNARAGRPEFAWELEQDGDWQRISGTFQAPGNATAARLELFLSHCPQGRVWWDDIRLESVPEPPTRMVTVGTANCRPTTAATNMGMAEQFFGVVEEAGRKGCDILLLGETITLPARGNVPMIEKAEPVPGPITDKFGELARRWEMYIIVGLLENENGNLYNTAVLIDRAGRVAGKYRKVFLPLEDLEGGIVPGDHYPVFDTDFGRVGIMICYDIQFPDPARALAAQGAEILFVPNWGNALPVAARALESHVFIASSGYDTPTDIYDPMGKRIAWAEERPSVAVAKIDLNGRYRHSHMRRRHDLWPAEMRPDVVVPALGPGAAK